MKFYKNISIYQFPTEANQIKTEQIIPENLIAALLSSTLTASEGLNPTFYEFLLVFDHHRPIDVHKSISAESTTSPKRGWVVDECFPIISRGTPRASHPRLAEDQLWARINFDLAAYKIWSENTAETFDEKFCNTEIKINKCNVLIF